MPKSPRKTQEPVNPHWLAFWQLVRQEAERLDQEEAGD